MFPWLQVTEANYTLLDEWAKRSIVLNQSTSSVRSIHLRPVAICPRDPHLFINVAQGLAHPTGQCYSGSRGHITTYYLIISTNI